MGVAVHLLGRWGVHTMPAFHPRPFLGIPGTLLAAVVLVAPLALAQDKPAWKELAPEGAGFTVLFPGEPAVSKLRDGGRAQIKRSPVEGISYYGTWTTREMPFATEEVAKAYLLGMQEGSAKAVKGKVISDKEITLDGVPGREFGIEAPENTVIRCRVFAVGDRIFNFQVWGKDKEAVQSTDPEKFFGSIKLTKPPAK
jgi:hypothetical protein